jgi:formylglycine-generating enzyme required for sulfatase activity
VGSFGRGASPYGLVDMAANAWEWTRTLYRDYPYRSDGRELTADPLETDMVVLRGGDWYDDYGSVRSTLRYGAPAQRSHDGVGFRCVIP